MAYIVLDNGMPADTSPQGAGSRMGKGIGWDNCRFDTMREAYEYAYKWLGEQYEPNMFVAVALVRRIFDKPRKYGSSGDTIQVKEI